MSADEPGYLAFATTDSSRRRHCPCSMATHASNTSTDSLGLHGLGNGGQVDASLYYGRDDLEAAGTDRHGNRRRTYSGSAAGGQQYRRPAMMGAERVDRPRRLSHGELMVARCIMHSLSPITLWVCTTILMSNAKTNMQTRSRSRRESSLSMWRKQCASY